VEFRQLLPEADTVSLDEMLASLRTAMVAGADRPRVLVNFVSSLDGRATFHGRSGPLGDDGDHAMFHGLREQADAVLVGPRTMGIERYGRILSRPERRERRVAEGRSPEPLACTVTRTGELPLDIPLFGEPEQRIVVFAHTDIELRDAVAQVDLVRLEPGEMTLTTVLRRLRSDYGVKLVLCEGGPTLFGAMLAEGLVDELFLTLVPKLTGGGMSPTITNGPELPELAEVMTIWLLERAGSLYLRCGLSQ
jgi:5-amino-6-(5-phosphoribosylamino)uracil reductase